MSSGMSQCVTRCVVPVVLKDCSRRIRLELIDPEDEGTKMVGTAYPVTLSHPRAFASSEVSYIFIVHCILCVSWECQIQSIINVENVFFLILRIYSSLFWHSLHCINPNTKCP